MRWAAATFPWLPGQGLLPSEAKQLHSLKSAAAAQLRLAKDDRLLQGHHRDSAAQHGQGRPGTGAGTTVCAAARPSPAIAPGI